MVLLLFFVPFSVIARVDYNFFLIKRCSWVTQSYQNDDLDMKMCFPLLCLVTYKGWNFFLLICFCFFFFTKCCYLYNNLYFFIIIVENIIKRISIDCNVTIANFKFNFGLWQVIKPKKKNCFFFFFFFFCI